MSVETESLGGDARALFPAVAERSDVVCAALVRGRLLEGHVGLVVRWDAFRNHIDAIHFTSRVPMLNVIPERTSSHDETDVTLDQTAVDKHPVNHIVALGDGEIFIVRPMLIYSSDRMSNTRVAFKLHVLVSFLSDLMQRPGGYHS